METNNLATFKFTYYVNVPLYRMAYLYNYLFPSSSSFILNQTYFPPFSTLFSFPQSPVPPSCLFFFSLLHLQPQPQPQKE